MGVFGELMGYERIEILSPYLIQQLSELKIVRQLNRHTTLYYTGIIPEANMDSYIQMASPKDTVVVNQRNNLGKPEPLFQGKVAEIGVKVVQGVYYLEVYGISHTGDLDVKLRDRSFQNKDLQYSDLLNQVMQGYPEGRVTDQAGKGKCLGQFTLQRRETDWRLLQRLASRFNTFLVPVDTVAKPELVFGLPDDNTEAVALDDGLPYLTGKDFPGVGGLSETDLHTDGEGVFYVVECGQDYPLGSKVRFKGMELVVAQSVVELQDSHLHFAYRLYPKSALKNKPFWNRQLTGTAIQGKVIEVEKDRVRVHLKIDDQQDRDTAWWFPCSSAYTAEGNSGFYCMPQLGDQVQVYFPNVCEADGIVTTSVRQNKGVSKTQAPDVKYFGTDKGKELKLGGDELTLTAKDQKEGKIHIKLNDETGVEIRSDNEIYLAAGKNLSFNLKKATIKAKEEIQLSCGESSINMDGNTHFKGEKVDVGPG